MPEGDALHRAARSLQVLVGQELEVETPHPRAAVKQLAPRLDGRRLESVEAIGKNLLLRFEGGVVLRSHLRMKGRWRVLGRDAPVFGTPWLVLRGEEHAGVLWNGPVLELDRGVARDSGRTSSPSRPTTTRCSPASGHAAGRAQSATRSSTSDSSPGIGNVWKVESLWAERVSPWRALGDVPDEELRCRARARRTV